MALVCQVCYQSGAIHQRTANRVIVISPMIDARAMGAMGAMGVPPEVGRYACRQGLLILAQAGERVAMLNDAKFQPRVW